MAVYKSWENCFTEDMGVLYIYNKPTEYVAQLVKIYINKNYYYSLAQQKQLVTKFIKLVKVMKVPNIVG